MNRSWIKLYLEILDDPKMGKLSDRLWRRSVELFLLAGKVGDDGRLPSVDEIAWALRATNEEVSAELAQLRQAGILSTDDAGWLVTSFKKRQLSESYERVKRFRERYSNVTEEEEVTLLPSSSSSSSKSYSDSEGGGGVGEKPTPMPETPRQAKEHPDIQVYEAVCKRFPAARDYVTIVETMQYLRKQHGENLGNFLTPYWAAWSTRKTRDGRKYSPASLVWLCEWAMQGEIPTANGHEPQSNVKETRADVIRKVAKNG